MVENQVKYVNYLLSVKEYGAFLGIYRWCPTGTPFEGKEAPQHDKDARLHEKCNWHAEIVKIVKNATV